MLIERGHIYIAQPPLYKVKRGKQEIYVKDDNELNAHAAGLGARRRRAAREQRGAARCPGRASRRSRASTWKCRPSSSAGLAATTSGCSSSSSTCRRSAAAEFDRADWMRDWTRDLAQHLNGLSDSPRSYRVELRQVDGHPARVHQSARPSTVRSPKRRCRRSSSSRPNTSRIVELGKTLAGLIGEGAYVTRGDAREEVGSFKQAMTWLLDQARKGQSIQRYKGLGEMNPEQLWETTINPATRRLMQVRIEDILASDEIFTTLMGDQVEPRREFIEKNALSVSNLDV